jgi:hypothetical protein
MTHANDTPQKCEAFDDDLTAIALGILTGRRRSEVLSHVEGCDRCSTQLEQLAIVADTVLLLAPEAETPLGFETRLAERLQLQPPPQRWTSLRATGSLVAAAVVILALGIGVEALVHNSQSRSNTPSTSINLASANLTSNGHVLGEFLVSAGHPSWMFMTVDSGSWSGPVTCEVVLKNGKVETVGTFDLAGGYGSWGAPLTSRAAQVREGRLVTTSGTVFARAVFKT